MAGKFPFPAKKAAPKKPMTMAKFEGSKYDVEKKGMKEGSKADMAMDKKQLAKANKSKKC